MAKLTKICAGQMRHRIVIERQTAAAVADDDIGGQPATPWSTYVTIWGAAAQASGTEGEQQDRTSTVEVLRVVTRYRGDITTEMRIVFNGRPWNISRVNNVQFLNRILEITATAGVPQ